MAGPLSRKGWRSPKQSTIGDLRHQVQVQYPDESNRDASGQIIDAWTSPTIVGVFWARVEPVTGRELLEAGQMQADVTHRVVMRYDASFIPTPKHRFIWLTGPANNILQVVTVLPTVGGANMLEILCLEEV